MNALLLYPVMGAEYCDQSVCLCVRLSVREHISEIVGPIFTKFCMPISCDRGSVLLWQRCDKLCTSGFMDDVTFGCSGRDAVTNYNMRYSQMAKEIEFSSKCLN